MFERIKHRGEPAPARRAGVGEAGPGATATADPHAPEERPVADRTAVGPEPAVRDPGPGLDRQRARQREAYGGINWGAAFFGWLVAVGMAVLLTGLLAAAGAAIGLTGVSNADVATATDTLTLGGAIALFAVLLLAYGCGGYVSGRMSRFDGARQGLGAWVIGLLVTVVVAVLALVAGSEYNVVERANLPRLPVGDESLTAGGAIATAAILVGTLVAATAGGKVGERYHRKVDRAGIEA